MNCTNTISSSVSIGHIDTNGLATLIASGISLVILDARSKQWDDGKRIATAQTLTDAATAEQAKQIIPSKQSLIIVYCSHSQCGASSRLAKKLIEFGYSYILKYEAGIQGWIDSGRDVSSSS